MIKLAVIVAAGIFAIVVAVAILGIVVGGSKLDVDERRRARAQGWLP